MRSKTAKDCDHLFQGIDVRLDIYFFIPYKKRKWYRFADVPPPAGQMRPVTIFYLFRQIIFHPLRINKMVSVLQSVRLRRTVCDCDTYYFKPIYSYIYLCLEILSVHKSGHCRDVSRFAVHYAGEPLCLRRFLPVADAVP